MKKPWQSKTIWANLILALSAFVPSVQDWMLAHPTVLPALFTVANIALRLITKEKISLLD